jgi:type III secretory pathway component EscS
MELINLFQNKTGYYNKQIKFEVILLCLGIIIILTSMFDKTYGFVILLLAFVLFISNTYVNVRSNSLGDFNKITMFKLNTLQDKANEYYQYKMRQMNSNISQNKVKQSLNSNYQLNSLFIDSNMIHFLYSILPLYQYNQNEFYLLLKSTDQLLQIKKEILEFYEANKKYPENIAEMFEISIQLKTSGINHLHNFIYSVPKLNRMYNYMNDVVNRYHILISRNTDDIHKAYQHYNKLTGINNSTKIISYYPNLGNNTTKPYDAMLNHNSNEPNKLIPFYI